MNRRTVLFVLFGSLTCAEAGAQLSVTIEGPTVIGFFPPVTQADLGNDNGGLSEAIAHLNFALQNIATCLGREKAAVSFEYTDSITLSNGDVTYHYDFTSEPGQAVGILLALPGKEPALVFATAGPSSLSVLGPQEVWIYFSEPSCQVYE